MGSTEAEARERKDELEARSSSEFRWRNMLWMIGLDPDGFDPDLPFPDELLATPPPTSGAERLFTIARRQPMPLRELARVHATLTTDHTFVGTAEQLADFIVDWHQAGAADGFTLFPTTVLTGLASFVDHVLPILRKRGLFSTEYEGTTLRDHLGLSRPRSRYVTASA
jgi:alkanesulfonate monooxygenase SsuD/methylene tetrahydromethanopterin reductase-like flavin-dependent oxidoreductase (luciferase family)